MPSKKIENFAAMLPSVAPYLLPDNYASYAQNVWLYRGELRGYRKPIPIYTLQSNTTKAVYRIPDPDVSVGSFVNSTWMEFDEELTDVIRAPQIEDQHQRYYIFSASQAPTYNTLTRIKAGSSPYLLGVPAPTLAPSISIVGVANTTIVTRSYVYTWETAYGEEGPPSPPATYTSDVTNTWALTLAAPGAPVTTGRNITKVNIYRTIANGDGSATFYRLASLPIATLTHNDTALDTAISGNLQLASTPWTPPPSDLQGCVALPNGIIAGWADTNTIYFCEPYRPHAWPVAYAVGVDYPIVGLGVSGQSLIVMTQGRPYIVSGVHPSAMTISVVPLKEPCISRNSIVSTEQGVLYASQNGMIMIMAGYGVGKNVSMPLFSREDWSALNPELFMGARTGTGYIGFVKRGVLVGGETYDGSVNDAFIMDGSTGAPPIYDGIHASFKPLEDQGDNGFVIDTFNENVTFTRLKFPGVVDDLIQDEYSGEVLIVSGGYIYQWDAPYQAVLSPYVWRSKTFELDTKRSFIAAKVHFTVPTTIAMDEPEPSTRNTDQNMVFDPETQYLILRIYRNDTQVLAREIQQSGELILIPGGTRQDSWWFQLEGQVAVSGLQFATSVKELGAV